MNEKSKSPQGLPSDYLTDTWDRSVEIWANHHSGATERDFNEYFANPICHDAEESIERGDDPMSVIDRHRDALLKASADPVVSADLALMIERYLAIVCIYALLSSFYEGQGDMAAAWEAAFFAQSFSVLVERADALKSTPSAREAVLRLTQRANDKRHEENRSAKADAFSWLNDHFDECKSLDDAAESLTKVIPMTFRTTRRYVDQWKLSRPSRRTK